MDGGSSPPSPPESSTFAVDGDEPLSHVAETSSADELLHVVCAQPDSLVVGNDRHLGDRERPGAHPALDTRRPDQLRAPDGVRTQSRRRPSRPLLVLVVHLVAVGDLVLRRTG